MPEDFYYFKMRYTALFARHFAHDSNRAFIGNKDNRVCRYCEKVKPEVEFRNSAHAVPNLIGNRWLFALDECDTCNKLFNALTEDHLAKYLGSMRTISQISGKKGFPSYKSKDGKSRIDVSATGLEFKHERNSHLIENDLENKKLFVRTHRQPYVPIAVYKSFVKMALAIMPLNELAKCQHLNRWIRSDIHEPLPFKPLTVLEQSTSGPGSYRGLHLLLLRRRESVLDCPYIYFIVAFGNVLYQVFLPMHEADHHLDGQNINTPIFPVPFGGESHGGKRIHIVDLQSDQVMRDDKIEHVLSYSHMEEVKKE